MWWSIFWWPETRSQRSDGVSTCKACRDARSCIF
jgi:hypothetical protein